MKKIIHLSDLHIGYKDLGERFNCLINNIIFLKEPATNYVIVITGDIVETATDPSNYEKARTYIKKLKDAGFMVLVVPGNHDYGSGAWGSTRYVQLFKKTFFGDPQITYPKVDVVGNIAFIGLDSMAEELHWYDRMWADGELGKPQLDRLDALFDQNPVKGCEYRVVYLHHHPFHRPPLSPLHHFCKLKDADELGEVLKHRKISALLHGHNHAGDNNNGKWGIKRCYDGGTATAKEDENSPHRVIDLGRDARWDYDAEFLTSCGV
jgi:3',5'-cyclic AMP phosphodiesterase CpdA